MARRSDHTREQLKTIILDTAWKIASEEGLSALTARRIATEIGYVPGTIYNIYSSMEELYLHINTRTLDSLYEILISGECNNPFLSTEDNAKRMAAEYKKFATRNKYLWLMLFHHDFLEGKKPDWYLEKIERLFQPLEKLLQPLFNPRQSQKRKIAARTLWASVHGIVSLILSGKGAMDENSSNAMASLLIKIFIKGLEIERNAGRT